jgi:hypothetical protein
MNPTSYESSPRVRQEAITNDGPLILFAEHHRILRRAAEDLLACCYEDNCRALIAEFRIFERQLIEHMTVEEELVLPAFAAIAAEEAAAILEAHRALRKQLERTAVDVELHSIRIASIRTLLAALDASAEHEDRTMYPWAQMYLPKAARDVIAERMFASVRKLTRLALG